MCARCWGLGAGVDPANHHHAPTYDDRSAHDHNGAAHDHNGAAHDHNDPAHHDDASAHDDDGASNNDREAHDDHGPDPARDV